jgi:small-conductance mechanosensitive channel
VVSERVISAGILVILVLHYLGALTDFQRTLEDITLPIGKSHFNLWQACTAVLLAVITLFVSMWISSLIEARLMGSRLDPNLRVVLSKFTRALLLLVGVLVALSVAGIDLTVLSVFGGALGVGIGLGLQKIASNYIAGFTILLDRSLRMGDVITVDGRYGVVAGLTARYVRLRGLDGVETIVPNETLVTTSVLNHSPATREIFMSLPFTVAYDTDLELAMRLLVEAADAQPRVLQDNFKPKGYVSRFGDNGVELLLGFWIRDPEQGRQNLTSEINLAAWRAFQKHGIRLPFPQREVRLLNDAART